MAALYREQFKPSKYLKEPKVNVTVQALCAPTDEEAQFIASSRNLSKAGQHLNLQEDSCPRRRPPSTPSPRWLGNTLRASSPPTLMAPRTAYATASCRSHPNTAPPTLASSQLLQLRAPRPLLPPDRGSVRGWVN